MAGYDKMPNYRSLYDNTVLTDLPKVNVFVHFPRAPSVLKPTDIVKRSPQLRKMPYRRYN